MRWISNTEFVSKTPIVTTLLLEGANVGQLFRMWREHSALGQSLSGWILVWIALALWWNFYRVCTPTMKWARYSVVFGLIMNTSVCLTVVYFRYFV